MNIHIVQNKYINSLFILMLLSAVVHLLVLCFLAVRSNAWYLLNYFYIIDIDKIINIPLSFSAGIISWLFAAAVYLIILKFHKKHP